MNKLNKFVEFVKDGEHTLLFNLQNEACIILNTELTQLVQRHQIDVDSLRNIHPDLYGQMKAAGMIVPAETDEVKQMIAAWEAADSDPSSFSMIINPTLGCNMRCWYCYEKHEKKPLMDNRVRTAIERLIEKKVADPRLRHISVSFFGGEPLLGFNDVVKPLLTYTGNLCKDKDTRFSSNFTTNATLLTGEVLDFVESVGLTSPATFQISLDGNREVHDQTRVGVSRTPTYDVIVGHLVEAARRGHQISARLNYTADNLLTFTDVAEEFGKLPEEIKRHIRFNFQHIWQDNPEGVDMEARLEELKKVFKEEGFPVDTDRIYHRHRCYADCENCVVINYDGNVFKCTARDFLPEKREGVLTPEGDIEWNERFHRRMEIKYSNPTCRACRILPLCNGGCSQNKLESVTNDTCHLHLSEEDKEQRIVGRLRQLAEQQSHN